MNIALICAGSTPIPATMGGATETMMTHMLEVNEERQEHHFHILGYYEEKAVTFSRNFKCSSFYCYSPNPKIEFLEGGFWRFLRKVTSERVYLRSRYIRWCADIINQSDFDVIVIEGNCFQIEYLRVLIGNRKIILHMHIDRLNRGLKAAGRMIKASDGVLAISQFCKNRMIEVDNCCHEKTIVVKNTIDTEKFTFKGEDVRAEIRKKLGICPNQKVVSYCGRINKSKGVLELIRAIKQLNDPLIHVLVMGSSVYFGSEKNKYIDLVEQEAKGITGGVTFTGYIPQADLPKYLTAVDIASVPSICFEAAGNVIIEALSCGIPVVASSQGGIPEYADLCACRLVDYNEYFVENLAIQIHELAYNNNLYTNLKRNARNVALQYDKCNYYVNYCNAIKQIIEL